jgi:hypothetical protein
VENDEKTLARKLNSRDRETVTTALWQLGVGANLPSGRALEAFIKRIADRRVYVREVAIAKAGKWSFEPRIASALVEQILDERNSHIINVLVGSTTNLVMHKHWGYQIVQQWLAKIIIARKRNKETVTGALKSLLFAHGLIGIKEFAKTGFEDIDSCIAKHRGFIVKIARGD